MVHGIKHNALFTSHAPCVQLVVILGVVDRQTGGSMSAEGGRVRGETMSARQMRRAKITPKNKIKKLVNFIF